VSDFVPLQIALRSPVKDTIAGEPSPPPPEAPSLAPTEIETAAVLSEIRRFRAAVADAFEYEVESLLRDVASDVLARELQLSPADVAAIVERARNRYAREGILAVRVHPCDAGALAHLDLDVLADPALRRGDVAIDLHSGTIDLSLGVRLAALLCGRVG
jgi:flagellar biosynthesis/type III secretory pathway protein FliH